MSALPFASVAALLRPVGDDPGGSTTSTIAPRSGSDPLGSLAVHAGRRELRLLRARGRARASGRPVTVHRFAAGGTRLRSRLGAGAVAATAPAGSARRVIDVVAEAAGFPVPVTSWRAAAGGGLVVLATGPGGRPAVLRAAGPGSPDPRGSLDPLHALEGLDVPAPVAIDAGEVLDVRWATETALPGHRPRRLDRALLQDVLRVLARFPPAPEPTAVRSDLHALAEALPDRAAALTPLTAAVAAAGEARFRHGDLWRANLLTAGGRLTGLVDWDAAHPGGVPGADLLQLLVTEDRHRRRIPLGAAWLATPWRDEDFLEVTRPYWQAIGRTPTAELLELAGLAWWAAETSGTLRRHPHRADDDAWLAANVDDVLAILAP